MGSHRGLSLDQLGAHLVYPLLELQQRPNLPGHNDADHSAWTSSIQHIRATPGFPDSRWPPVDGLSLSENLRDLERHADDFERRLGFTYTVIDDEDRVIGCVYIYPSRSNPQVTEVQSWVTASSAELDVVLHDAVADWLATDWPFTDVSYRPTA